jgi:methylase of polypeptide subunit release factors
MLDIGCSNGLLGAAVRSELGKDWTIDGVDYNCSALAEAAQWGCRHTILVDLNRQCPQLDGPYDLIIMGDL